jgi:hypothetical protein
MPAFSSFNFSSGLNVVMLKYALRVLLFAF